MSVSFIEILDILSYIVDRKSPLVEKTQIFQCNNIIDFGIKK